MPEELVLARPIRLTVDVERRRRRLVVGVHDDVVGHYTVEIQMDHVRAIARCLDDAIERYPSEFPLSHARRS